MTTWFDGMSMATSCRPEVDVEAYRAWRRRCRNRVVVLLDLMRRSHQLVVLVGQSGVDAGEEVL
jgi:hypothetical protein